MKGIFKKIMPLFDTVDGMGGAEKPESADPAEENTAITQGGEELEEVTEEEGEEEPESADPVPAVGRKTEADAAFAAMRRQAEQSQMEAENLRSILEGMFPGEEDPVVAATSHVTGKAPDQILAERKAVEELKRLSEENEQLKQFHFQAQIERDLNAIKKAHPEVQIKSLDELGQNFINIMSTGAVDAVTAYDIMQSKKQRETVTPPPQVGKVNTGEKVKRDYYTKEEVDAMSKEEVHTNYEKIRESMRKWT